VKRPWLCRWGFHRWGPNARTGEHWQRRCSRRRCRAPLTFTAEPFTFGPLDRRRERKRAARETAEMGA
jgi:hypothetical protein